jgi:hypothetical protein
MSILDGYAYFTRNKYVKSQKSTIVYGHVYEFRRFREPFLSFLPYFKGGSGLARANAGCGLHTEPSFPVLI